MLALLVIGRLATLPFALRIRAQNLEYGLTTQSFAGWVADQGRSLAVATVTTSSVSSCSSGSPGGVHVTGTWPGAAAVVLSFAGSLLYPVLVEPLFNRFTPMADGPFKTSVLRLASREGVDVDQVLVADASRRTTTLNAYVSGIGGTRRVVVYDTLVNGLSRREAMSVIAHELAHAKNHDVLLGTSLGALGGAAGVGLLALLLDSDLLRRRSAARGAADPAAAALVLALVAVGGLLASPVSNSISRAIEARADRVAIEAIGDPAAFVSMQRQLAIEAIHDPTPPPGASSGSAPTRRCCSERAFRHRWNGPGVSRILFVTNDFPTRRGGIESFVLALCQNLPPDEVVVYTASMPGDAEHDATLPFPVHRDPSGSLLPTPAVARRIEGVMREYGVDRVVFGASAPLGLLATRLRKTGARRIVALTHGHEAWWARVPVARQLLRRIGDSVDVMTYVSEWCRDRIVPALSRAGCRAHGAAVTGGGHESVLPGLWGRRGTSPVGDPRRSSGGGMHGPDDKAEGPGHPRQGMARRAQSASRCAAAARRRWTEPEGGRADGASPGAGGVGDLHR